MRVLVATTGNDGHFGPLLPFAQALVAAGHEVRVAAPASYAVAVEAAGLAHAPFADPHPELVGPVMERLPTLSFDEANRVVLREIFARIDAQAALPAVRAVIADWTPDLVVRESAELGSLAAAESAWVPHAQVSIGMTEMAGLFPATTAEALAELGGIAGLPGDRLVAAIADEPILSTVPESLDLAGADRSADHLVGPTSRFGDPTRIGSGGRLPDAWGVADAPLVYVTFGSVTGALGVFDAVFRGALEALADLPVRVLMTVGRRLDLSTLEPIPANARVVAWWPQADVLASAAVVVGHGGFGTTMGAVAAGLPQAVVPIFSQDQVINARHVAATGAGVLVEGGPMAGQALAEAVRRLLDDASYAVAARGLAHDLAALPDLAGAVPLLEGLAVH